MIRIRMEIKVFYFIFFIIENICRKTKLLIRFLFMIMKSASPFKMLNMISVLKNRRYNNLNIYEIFFKYIYKQYSVILL